MRSSAIDLNSVSGKHEMAELTKYCYLTENVLLEGVALHAAEISAVYRGGLRILHRKKSGLKHRKEGSSILTSPRSQSRKKI